MDALLGSLVVAIVVVGAGATLWLLPSDGYGQAPSGTDDWPHGADHARRDR